MSSYRERVWPSVWVFAIGLLAVPAVVVVFAPIQLLVGIMLALTIYAGYVVFLVSSAPVIEVTADLLRVGSARIPLRFTGRVDAMADRQAARSAAGPSLDARAWLCLRGWVATSARVEVTDQNDPVPYWLFSTRDPEAVRRAIESARGALPKQ